MKTTIDVLVLLGVLTTVLSMIVFVLSKQYANSLNVIFFLHFVAYVLNEQRGRASFKVAVAAD